MTQLYSRSGPSCYSCADIINCTWCDIAKCNPFYHLIPFIPIVSIVLCTIVIFVKFVSCHYIPDKLLNITYCRSSGCINKNIFPNLLIFVDSNHFFCLINSLTHLPGQNSMNFKSNIISEVILISLADLVWFELRQAGS